MLANASHELRSPLARIRVALELHETDPRPNCCRASRQDCAEIEEQIEEILLASKLETVDIALPRTGRSGGRCWPKKVRGSTLPSTPSRPKSAATRACCAG